MTPAEKWIALASALDSEAARRGTVNPQFSYYDRLVTVAFSDDDLLARVYHHVVTTGGFAGL